MTATLQDKFVLLGENMETKLFEREDEIEIFKLAVVARANAFFLGDPGVAKSMLIELGMSLIEDLTEDDYFEFLMMKTTTKEDIFGPLRLSLLKEDRYVFKPEGFLPAAKFAFLDEFWKANAAILNSLLWAAYARKYRNDGKVIPMPLHSIFIASNERPKDSELRAIEDRFPLRKWVADIVEPGHFTDMLGTVANKGVDLKPVMNWADVEAASAESTNVVIPHDVLEAMTEIRMKLREEGIFPSPRRFALGIPIIKAHTWLAGETESDVGDLDVLRHVLWTDPSDYQAVERVMLTLVNPLDLEVMKIANDLKGLSNQIEILIADQQIDEETRVHEASNIFDKVEAADKELDSIKERLKSSTRRSQKLAGANRLVSTLAIRIMVDVYHTDPAEIQAGVQTFLGGEDG